MVVGDTFLLCSDGLSGQVKDEEMGAILSACRPPRPPGRWSIGQSPRRSGQHHRDHRAHDGPLVASEGEETVRASLPPPIRRPIPPAMWAVLSVLTLTGLVLLAGRLLWPAVVSLLAAAAVGAASLVQRYGSDGNSPCAEASRWAADLIRQCNAPPSDDFAQQPCRASP